MYIARFRTFPLGEEMCVDLVAVLQISTRAYIPAPVPPGFDLTCYRDGCSSPILHYFWLWSLCPRSENMFNLLRNLWVTRPIIARRVFQPELCHPRLLHYKMSTWEIQKDLAIGVVFNAYAIPWQASLRTLLRLLIVVPCFIFEHQTKEANIIMLLTTYVYSQYTIFSFSLYIFLV